MAEHIHPLASRRGWAGGSGPRGSERSGEAGAAGAVRQWWTHTHAGTWQQAGAARRVAAVAKSEDSGSGPVLTVPVCVPAPFLVTRLQLVACK